MGQYYRIACPDRDEGFSPSLFGEGLKLMEFSSGRNGSLAALAVLLALPSTEERGGWTGDSPLMGSWAGKRLVVTGDYADEGRFVPPEHQNRNLYGYIDEFGDKLGPALFSMLVEVAGPQHPAAAKLITCPQKDNYFFDAPAGMVPFLDPTQAEQLEFSSLGQLLAFGWEEPGLDHKTMDYNVAKALRFIGLKFKVAVPQLEHLQLTLSADEMRVESMTFEANGEQLTWSFPLKAGVVYRWLGIL